MRARKFTGKVLRDLKRTELLNLLADRPVIAAVKDEAGLNAALNSGVSVVFLLWGSILDIEATIGRLHSAGKTVFVHLDLVEGLSGREVAVDYIAKHTSADGIISTKPQLTKRAGEVGLLSVQRVFLLDSMALKNAEHLITQDSSDLIEVLPGAMPKIIRRICTDSGRPIIAGGLIFDKDDVIGALGAGAVAVSSTTPAVWSM